MKFLRMKPKHVTRLIAKQSKLQNVSEEEKGMLNKKDGEDRAKS